MGGFVVCGVGLLGRVAGGWGKRGDDTVVGIVGFPGVSGCGLGGWMKVSCGVGAGKVVGGPATPGHDTVERIVAFLATFGTGLAAG